MKARARLVAAIGRFGIRRNRPSAAAKPAAPHRSDATPASSPARSSRRPLQVLTAALILALTLVLGVALADAAAPTVTIEPATPAYTTAHVKGEVNPEGTPTTYAFQYITDAAFEENLTNSLPGFEGAQTGPSGSVETAAETVEGNLTELAPNTKYHLRLHAENGETADAVTATFTTKPVTAPVVSAPTFSEVKFTTAKAAGSVTAGNADPAFNAPCHFEYITETLFQENLTNSLPGFEGASSEACDAEPTGTAPTPVTANLTELAPGTKYHLRLVAENLGGRSAEEAAETFTTEAVAKPSVSIEAPSLVNASTGHYYLAGHVNPNAPESEPVSDPAVAAAFKTHWRFECEPACGSPGGELAADDSSHLVDADVENLQPNTKYTVTLHAENAGGEKTAQVSFKTPAFSPGVLAGTNTPEGEGDVLLRGYVNPRNSEVSACRFAYGLTEGYGSTVPCEVEGEIGSGATPVEVTAKLSGLAPGTTYHFQLRATGAAGVSLSEDAVFRTFSPEAAQACENQALRVQQHATFLPDCRAYEMVSPPEKNGGDVMGVPSRTRAAVSGDAAEFSSLSAFGDAQGIGAATEYIAERDSVPGTQGWSTHSITPKLDPFTVNNVTNGYNSGYFGEFSPDLSQGIFRTGTNLSGDPLLGNVANLYLRSNLLTPGAATTSTVTLCPICTEPFTKAQQAMFAGFAGATADFGQIVFETALNLTPDASGTRIKTYEYVHGTVRLVGILPASAGGGMAPASVAGTGARSSNYTLNIISADGRRIFFTDNSQTFGKTGTLYMRVDHAETVQINASERSEPEEPQPAKFQTASADGTKVFFITSEGLIDGDDNNSPDIYMYDAGAPEGHHLTLISADHEPAASPAGSVSGVIGASEDGSYVYFYDQYNQLVAGGPPVGGSGEGPYQGIYVWHQGSLRYLGKVSGSEESDANSLGETFALASLGSRVSPDGRHLLFTASSGLNLTGYDQSNPSCNHGCSELYAYSYPTGTLTCASCNPSGAAPTGNTSFNLRVGLGASQPTSHLGHALSTDGRYVFFTSPDPLVAADTNGVNDAYSYDSQTGKFHLLSAGAGTGTAASYFLDASPDGSDAFFATRGRLLGWDTDGAYDLYDARALGGFPEPPPQPAACVGEGCQGAGVANATQASAGSAVFAGPGNAEHRCPKGKVKKHGKCVKKAHRKQHKKSHRKSKRAASANRGGAK